MRIDKNYSNKVRNRNKKRINTERGQSLIIHFISMTNKIFSDKHDQLVTVELL